MASRGFLRGGREALGFWVVTLGLCALAGLGSYALGRNWVGRTLGEAISSENVQIKPQQKTAGAANAVTEDSGPPPAQAKVDLEPREPSDAEKQDLAAQGVSNSVAPGAAAGAEGATPPADTSTPAAAAGGTYQVTAGSYGSATTAERVKSELEQHGYHPTITVVKRRGTTYHKIIVGAYDDKQQAESVRKDVEAAGYAAGVSGGD